MPESPQLDEVLPTVCCPEGPVLLLVLLVGSSLLPWKLVGLALCAHVWHISGTPGVIPSQHHVGPGGHLAYTILILHTSSNLGIRH